MAQGTLYDFGDSMIKGKVKKKKISEFYLVPKQIQTHRYRNNDVFVIVRKLVRSFGKKLLPAPHEASR